MININQTSENSKIYIQRNITNDEPVINNYVTEDELQEILKEYNNVPYLFIRNDGDIISGDFDAVYDAVKNDKPYLIYVYTFSNSGLYYSPAECVSLVAGNGIQCTYDLTYVALNDKTKLLYRVLTIFKNGAAISMEQERVIPTQFKTINGNDILGEGDIEIDVDLTGYATEQWVDDKGYLKEIPSEFITETELADKNYVDTSYLNGELEAYAKQSYVDDAIANVGNGNIVELTQSEYDNITPEENTLYIISDAPAIEIPDTSNFVDKETLNYEIDAINISLSQKQDTLVSGVNIKTINGNDILGEGDIEIDVDLTGYATTAYVDDQLGNINNILENIIG